MAISRLLEGIKRDFEDRSVESIEISTDDINLPRLIGVARKSATEATTPRTVRWRGRLTHKDSAMGDILLRRRGAKKAA